MNKSDFDILMEYNTRRHRSEEQFREFKKKIEYARAAFNQEPPLDILRSIVATPKSGNGGEKGNNGASRLIYPMFTAICNKMIESLHAMPPRYEWAANTNEGIETAWALELELMKCYTKSNIGAKIPLLLWHLVVDGVFAQQTVYRKMEEKLRLNDEDVETIYNGGTIDFVIYDPLTCYFDWDAEITDMRRTSKFFIATLSTSITEDGLKAKYGDKLIDAALAEIAASKSGDTGDAIKELEERQHGFVKPIESHTLREYYKNNGMCYSIIDDCYIVKKGYVPSGAADQIPINIGVAYIDPASKLGVPLWEKVKWAVALMSQAVNQVADRNAANNQAPYFTTATIDGNYAYDKLTGRKVVRLDTFAANQDDVRKLITQFLLPEVLQGAEFMFNQGLQALFYVTGTNSMAFGIQDKQIRTSDVASMIGASLVRSDSDIAKKLETSFFNPVTWDLLRIFYVQYSSFDFKEDVIPRDFLKRYKDIRVVNGSYLTADKAERLGKLMQVLNLAAAAPNAMKISSLYHDVIQAIGFINPMIYLKSGNEMMLEELMMFLASQEAGKILTEEELQTTKQAIDVVRAASSKIATQTGEA